MFTRPLNYSKNVSDRSGRMASKTIRKLTDSFLGQSEPISWPKVQVVNLDMLHVMIECNIKEPEIDQDLQQNDIRWLSEDMCLEYQHIGTPVFKHKWHIYQHGEKIGTLMTHTRHPKRIKEGLAKLEIENHLFYSRNWYIAYNEILLNLRAELRNISQLHIAIDGCNHLYYFLNAYDKQLEHTAVVKKKGKATFDAKQKRHFMANNFKIGSGHKYFTVYNKTSEIEKVSNKEYIRNIWNMNGMDTTGDVWRCELRLASQAIRSIKGMEVEAVDDEGNFMFMPNLNEWEQGIDIAALLSTDYLMKIFKTECKNFFEFVINTGDSNISREEPIELFGNAFQQVTLLGKVKRPLSRGFYKAKMAIHNAVSNVLLKHIRDAKGVKAALLHVSDNIHLYDLNWFYKKKLPEWIAKYQPTRTEQDYSKYALKLLEIANN